MQKKKKSAWYPNTEAIFFVFLALPNLTTLELPYEGIPVTLKKYIVL